MIQDIILVTGSRTSMGSFQGGLVSFIALVLGVVVIKESLKCADIADE